MPTAIFSFSPTKCLGNGPGRCWEMAAEHLVRVFAHSRHFPSSHRPLNYSPAASMARVFTRILRLAPRRNPPAAPPAEAALRWRWTLSATLVPPSTTILLAPFFSDWSSERGTLFPMRVFRSLGPTRGFSPRVGRGCRKLRRMPREANETPLELDVRICIEEDLPDDPEIISIAEALKSDVPMATRAAFDCLQESNHNNRDISIDDLNKYEKVELSILLCDDGFIQKLNKDWRDEDQPTDVLSMSQHIPELDLPILLLGDIVVSIETAARQAQERGHMLLDEIRILVVHGLLHLLGFDHEISHEAEAEMQKEEERILNKLGWKGKGLIKSAYNAGIDESLPDESSGEITKSLKKHSSSGQYETKLSYIFCDLDGNLFNGKSQIAKRKGEALREAVSRGVKVVILSGKTRTAIIRALSSVDSKGKDGIISESSPGVFLQGSLVYGRQGQEIYRVNLDQDVCREALLYSLEHEVPLVAFSQERCLALREHPSVDLLHTLYHEPKAEMMPSVEYLLAASDIQKLLFLDIAGGMSSILLPYWLEATRGRARVVQPQPKILEIIPCECSKGSGVQILLNHLGISVEERMPIFDEDDDGKLLQHN